MFWRWIDQCKNELANQIPFLFNYGYEYKKAMKYCLSGRRFFLQTAEQFWAYLASEGRQFQMGKYDLLKPHCKLEYEEKWFLLREQYHKEVERPQKEVKN